MRIEEKMIEFDQIKTMWQQYALTDAAKQKIQNMVPFLDEIQLRSSQKDTTESRIFLEKCGNPPVVSLQGMMQLLEIADKGECLSAQQLSEIETCLVAVARCKEYLNRGKTYQLSLAYYEENLDPLSEVKEAIYTQIVNDQVTDYASKWLKTLRADIAEAEQKMREKADAVIRANKECMADSFSTLRNGRICIPVKKECKQKIAGSVIDKSATGNTLFIEPAASAKYYEELQSLRMDEENEVRRILYELTVLVDEHAQIFQENIRMMEKIDFIFSKGKLSLEMQGIEPEITTDRRITLQDARHPLMDMATAVPLQFAIGGDVQGIVITGPNTGGKTVAIKTVALHCLMAQCGLHVPCREASICMNSNFLCDIGDGQNLSENLSTFSAHITNVLDILRRVNSQSLVIMDELGSGTDPLEGMGIAVAILEELKASGALFLVTTHYPEVKVYAQKTEGIVNARMTFDKENLRPLYQMVIGEAGESCAFYIAKRLGMPSTMLKKAVQTAYGEGNLQEYEYLYEDESSLRKEAAPRIVVKKESKKTKEISFQIGDSVMVLPDRKIGIVCKKADSMGNIQVQLPGKKILINYKRVKLLVAAEQLYPEDYDFSIIFDTVENRKLRHKMERKYVEGEQIETTE